MARATFSAPPKRAASTTSASPSKSVPSERRRGAFLPPHSSGKLDRQEGGAKVKASSRSTPITRVVAAALASIVLLAFPAFGASKYKVLHTFGSGKDGSFPSGPLTLDRKGDQSGSALGGVK